MLSYAAMDAASKLDFRPVRGRTVFLDETYYEFMDKGFVIGEIRSRILSSGARLANKKELAEVVLEVRSAGLGIDKREILVGIPAIGVPAPTAQAVTLPELALVRNVK